MKPARESAKERYGDSSPRKKLWSLVAVVVVVVAGFSIYYAYEYRNQGTKQTITVLTYSSFMKYGRNPNATLQKIIGGFEKKYNVNVKFVYAKIGVLQTLESPGNHSFDVVVGLTGLSGLTAISKKLLVSYRSPDDTYVSSSVLKQLGDASNYLTPYEYSYLGIDYNRSFVKNFRPSFENLTSGTLASNLLLENPTTSSTGEEFLLWEISYYKYILGLNWTGWWKQIKLYIAGHIFDSWGSAFNSFETGGNTNLLVSYLTDPAYNVYFGYGNGTGSQVTYHNGKAYGWRSIFTAGIVNGSKHISLDEAFINYFLSPNVQDEIPTNEWMFPANSSTPLPPSFGAVIDQGTIIPLNSFMNNTLIKEKLSEWMAEWVQVMQ